MAKQFRKSTDRKLCGVCGGIAEYLDIDPTIVRILWVVLVLFGGTGILLYIILALLMPN
ncbi:MAG: PspC domain-containing protein [Treponema sp.]|nr:PspC domain-containing protein [Treponema sp.]